MEIKGSSTPLVNQFNVKCVVILMTWVIWWFLMLGSSFLGFFRKRRRKKKPFHLTSTPRFIQFKLTCCSFLDHYLLFRKDFPPILFPFLGKWEFLIQFFFSLCSLDQLLQELSVPKAIEKPAPQPVNIPQVQTSSITPPPLSIYY